MSPGVYFNFRSRSNDAIRPADGAAGVVLTPVAAAADVDVGIAAAVVGAADDDASSGVVLPLRPVSISSADSAVIASTDAPTRPTGRL